LAQSVPLNLVRRHGTLDGVLDAGLFRTEAEMLRLYREDRYPGCLSAGALASRPDAHLGRRKGASHGEAQDAVVSCACACSLSPNKPRLASGRIGFSPGDRLFGGAMIFSLARKGSGDRGTVIDILREETFQT
jgi:hypothetical protein